MRNFILFLHKNLFQILFIILLLQIINIIYLYRENYMIKFDPGYWQARYVRSQWVTRPACVYTDPHINPETCTWDDGYYQKNKNKKFVPNNEEKIGDDGLYAYAAWEYIHGKDPSLLNAEVPPLGKYLIGVSELIFINQNVFALLSGLLVLFSFYILNKIIFKNEVIAIIPVILLSFEPLFYNQLRAPYLDSLYLLFLILIMVFILKRRFLVVSNFIGLMMATKAASASFILVTVVIIAYLAYMGDYKDLKKFLKYLPFAILVFLLTYIQYFLLGHNLRDFLSLQEWVLNFYETGAKGMAQSVWQIILSGNWPTWWGTVERVSEWNILWPLSLIATVYYLYRVLPKRRQFRSILFAFWIAAYLIFLMFVPVWPRYLLVVLPFMFALSVWVLTKTLPKLILKSKIFSI